MKVKYKQIAKSLTGFSTPIFGVSWNPPETDRRIARNLLIFLEDRRALFGPLPFETPEWVVESVLEMRKELTNLLQSLGEESDIFPHLRAMRAACRKFLNECRAPGRPEFDPDGLLDNYFLGSLGELRAFFGVQIAQLAVKYGIDIEEELASILPIEDK